MNSVNEFKFLTINTVQLWKSYEHNQRNIGYSEDGIYIKSPSKEGSVYISKALDSFEPHVQWHRIVVEPLIPPDCMVVKVSYFASDNNASSSIPAENSTAWIPVTPNNPRDALLVNAKGRYLFLKITLLNVDKINRSAYPVVKNITAYYPRLSYLRYLPAIYHENETSRDIMERFLSIFESLLTDTEEKIFHFTKHIDPKTTPEDFLPWLASWLSLAYDERWAKANIRNFIQQAPFLFRKRGTREGLEQIIAIYLDKHGGGRSSISKEGQDNRVGDRPRYYYEEKKNGKRNEEEDNNNNNDNTCKTFPLFKVVGGQQYRISILEGYELDHLKDEDYKKLYDIYKSDKEYDNSQRYYNPNAFSFFVLLDPNLSMENFDVIKRIIENEKPAHTFACIKLLQPWFYVGMHTYLGINTLLNKQTFIVEKLALV
jgi:phage tail-like protein